MKTTAFFLLLFLYSFFLASCGNEVRPKETDTIVITDTSATHFWMLENRMENDLLLADTAFQNLELDTFELTYRMCDCPDWIDKTKGDLECRECTDFYIEPASIMLNLPVEIFVNGNTIRFYGKAIPGMNIPKGKTFATNEPEPWTVIRYYGYEVVRPYRVLMNYTREIYGNDTIDRPTVMWKE